MLGVNLHIAVGVVAADFDVAIGLLHNNHAFIDFGVVLGMDACIDGTRIDFRIGGAGGVDDGVVVIVRAVRISALMDAARVAQRIVAVTTESDNLRVFIEHRV